MCCRDRAVAFMGAYLGLRDAIEQARSHCFDLGWDNAGLWPAESSYYGTSEIEVIARCGTRSEIEMIAHL
jgi:hypothetical protein